MTKQARPTNLTEALRALEKLGARMTQQRLSIVETALALDGAYTAEELFEVARGRNSEVSRATVYRTLPLLLEANLLRKIFLNDEPARYELQQAEQGYHSYIWCLDCENMISFEDYCLDLREAALIKGLGFSARDVRLRVEASCDTFTRTGRCGRIAKAKV